MHKASFKIEGLKDITLELDTQELEGAIEEAISNQINYAIRDQVRHIVEVWVAGLIEVRKEEILTKLKPDIDKHIDALRLSTNRY